MAGNPLPVHPIAVHLGLVPAPETPRAQNSATQWSGQTCYVRRLPAVDPRFVSFEFSIGTPALGVELVMTPAQFQEFCARHQVVFLSEAQSEATERAQTAWRFEE